MPVMVTVTVCVAVPSALVAVKLSLSVAPAARLLDRGLRVGGAVGPVAPGVDAEAAVAVAAGDAGLGEEAGLSAVDVDHGERAAGDEVAADDGGVFGDATADDTADDGDVVGAGDGDGDDLAGAAVGADGGEAVGERGTGGELLDRGLGVAGAVAPVAGGVQRERAVPVAAGGAGLYQEGGFAIVDVGHGQGAAGGEVAQHHAAVFGDVAGDGAAEDGEVVGAGDGDGDGLRGSSVGTGGREAVAERGTGGELLDRGLRVGGAVGPVAGDVNAEAAVAVAAGDAGLGEEAGLSAVDVDHGERAAGDEVAADDGGVFGDATADGAADDGDVVGAGDGDGDDLAGAAVGADGGEAVGERGTGGELLDRGLGVAGAVAPVAGGVQRERAVPVAAGGAGLYQEGGFAIVDVGHGQGAAGGEVAADDRGVFGDAAGDGAAEDGEVVGAGDRDSDDLAGAAVGTGGGEAVAERGAGGEGLDRGLRVGGAVGPVAGRVHGKRAIAVAAGDAGLGEEAGLSAVDVDHGERAAGDEVAADDGGVFGDATADDAADDGNVVAAGDGDGDDLAGAAVGADGGEAVGERGTGGELLDRGLGVAGAVAPVAGGVQRERAVPVAAGGAGLYQEGGFAVVDVGHGQGAAGGEVAADDALSSVTPPLTVPPRTARSLLPVMVMASVAVSTSPNASVTA